MNDDSLKSMFDGFDPQLGSDRLFMERLQRRLDTVEDVKHINSGYIRSLRRRAVIASLAGFAAGIITTLLMPWISGCIESTLSQIHVPVNNDLTPWLTVSLTSLLAAFWAYDITAPAVTKAP